MQLAKASVLEMAITWLIMNHPFYASILLKRELRATTAIPTACVDARGTISYNPNWFATLNKRQIAFVLAHECMHYMFCHLLRRGTRDGRLFNVACDAVINCMLLACGFTTDDMPEGGITYPGAEDMNAEHVYDLIKDDHKYNQKGQPGGGDGDWGIGEDLDDSVPLTEEARSEIEAETRVDIHQAVESAKRMGKLGGPLKRLAEELLAVKTPWYDKFYRFFTRAGETDFAYPALDRRFVGVEEYLPWYTGTGKLGKGVFICDVSGSISAAEYATMGHHLNHMLDTCQPEEFWVVFVHTEIVGEPKRYTPEDYPVVLECDDSGGTDMTVGIRWAMKHHSDADLMVVFTDGYTPFGNPCDIPTFWAITSKHKRSPWGETVHVEVTDE